MTSDDEEGSVQCSKSAAAEAVVQSAGHPESFVDHSWHQAASQTLRITEQPDSLTGLFFGTRYVEGVLLNELFHFLRLTSREHKSLKPKIKKVGVMESWWPHSGLAQSWTKVLTIRSGEGRGARALLMSRWAVDGISGRWRGDEIQQPLALVIPTWV